MCQPLASVKSVFYQFYVFLVKGKDGKELQRTFCSILQCVWAGVPADSGQHSQARRRLVRLSAAKRALGVRSMGFKAIFLVKPRVWFWGSPRSPGEACSFCFIKNRENPPEELTRQCFQHLPASEGHQVAKKPWAPDDSMHCWDPYTHF